MTRRFLKTDPVTPHFTLPRVIRSRRQYVTWTKRARDVLVKYHRYPAADFIRIGKSEPSMNGGPMYPEHWKRIYSGSSSWLERLPRGAVVYWPDGVDISSEAYDPQCPVLMLQDIQFWEFEFTYSYEDQDQ